MIRRWQTHTIRMLRKGLQPRSHESILDSHTFFPIPRVEERTSCGLNPEKVRNALARDDWRISVFDHILKVSDGDLHMTF